MMILNIQGNLLNRTEALEAGKAGIDADNFTAAGKATICDFLALNYSALIDVTSSVFAASGTGYKPTKKGVLFVKCLNAVNSSEFWIYSANGTLLFNRLFNSSGGSQDVSGSVTNLPLTPDNSVRVGTQYGTLGIHYYAIFVPYKGN